MHPAGVYIGRVESHMKKYENDKMIIFIVFHIFHNFDFFRPEKIQKPSSRDRFLEIPGWPRGGPGGSRSAIILGRF